MIVFISRLKHGAGLLFIGYCAKIFKINLSSLPLEHAYALADLGIFIAYQGNTDSVILTKGDEILFNPYHIIADLARDYIDFVTDKESQKIIREYRMQGQQLLYPDAMPDI